MQLRFSNTDKIIAHTGMHFHFATPIWQSATDEEGILIREDGGFISIPSGYRVFLPRFKKCDIMLFRKNRMICRDIGVCGVEDCKHNRWGGYAHVSIEIVLPIKLVEIILKNLPNDSDAENIIVSAVRSAMRIRIQKYLLQNGNGNFTIFDLEENIYPAIETDLLQLGLGLRTFSLMNFQKRHTNGY